MSSSPLSFSYHSALEQYNGFNEHEDELPEPLPHAVHPDITVTDEDVDCDMQSPDFREWDTQWEKQQASMTGHGRRASLSYLNIDTMSLRESPTQDEGEDEDAPLVRNGSPTKGKQRAPGKARRKIGALFQRLQRRKRAVRGTVGSVATEGDVHDPFDDENAMDWKGGELAEAPEHASNAASGSGGAEAQAPKTPHRGGCSSTPTTPGASAWSAKTRRSSASWQRSPRTPRSAKSWLSDSSPGSLSITGSVTSSLRRKNIRRRQREHASQMKSMQILGSEAGAAIAKAANIKETKLRYREFDRKLRDQLKRTL
ncbi:hypothetical protein PYCCODRAFT_1477800 [Trametes coccinea BRFM310]|uniref:Uncharacterized protein n=1 Tax=Trametes coccinea (strain BRFM310) TaxID=1353009 RepID=A0A1Y2IM88_TRAC3|nr:hypothetical protein PYCCODRAFT_1477800 [Trametes coccinea BRFM310]